MSRAQLDAALADHRVLTHEEALTVAKALDILERHAEGIRNHTGHPQAGFAADTILKCLVPIGGLLTALMDTGMIAPRGYRTEAQERAGE